MAEETSSTRFAALPPRQKVTIVVFLLIAVFVVWEVIGMFRGGSNAGVTPAIAAASKPSGPPPMTATPPTPGPKPAMTASSPTAVSPSPATPPGPHKETPAVTLPAAPPPKVAAHLSPDQSRPEIEKTLPQTAFLAQQERIQNAYVAALNDLQMLKIKKEIAETSQAIVAAKLATATAEKSISDLLSEAEAAAAPPPPGAGKKGAPGGGPSSTNVSPPPPTPTPMTDLSGTSYSVQSVSMEQDQWHAVLKFKEKLYDVSVGDVLPPDKSTVKAIDGKGVTLDSGGMEQKIPLTATYNETPVSSSESGGGGAPPSGGGPPSGPPPGL